MASSDAELQSDEKCTSYSEDDMAKKLKRFQRERHRHARNKSDKLIESTGQMIEGDRRFFPQRNNK